MVSSRINHIADSQSDCKDQHLNSDFKMDVIISEKLCYLKILYCAKRNIFYKILNHTQTEKKAIGTIISKGNGHKAPLPRKRLPQWKEIRTSIYE